MESIITFCGQQAKVNCDGNCNKAWGESTRPKHCFNDPLDVPGYDPIDDWCYLSDDEPGDAPSNPGSMEGFDIKPSSNKDFPNKWCVRECERCNMSSPGKFNDQLNVIDLSKRFYNYKSRRIEAEKE